MEVNVNTVLYSTLSNDVYDTYRLAEGDGEAMYEIGVDDDGTCVGK